MNKWYYLVKGKAQGPVTENQIRDLIREHQLTLNDIIFKEGDSKWRRISEFPETNFAQEAVGETNLQQLVRLPTKSDSGKWVVLLKIQTETEIKFVQKGSWSTDEVKAAIQRGEVSYSDHIWKSGFTKWERIGDLDEFSFKGETQIFSLSTPSKLKLSDSDLEIKREATSTATKAALRSNPVPEDKPTDDILEKTSKVDFSEKTEQVVAEDFSEKTRMGFSLKLDKSRLSDLIQKASQEVDEGKIEKVEASEVLPENEKTVIDTSFDDAKTQIAPAPKIPGTTVSASKVATTKSAATPLVFDDDEENRKEPSIWMATRTGKTKGIEGTSKTKTKARQRRAKKRKFWNTIFQATQITLVLVILGLGFATFQNIQKKRKKAEAQAFANEAPEVAKPKKRKAIADDISSEVQVSKPEVIAEVKPEASLAAEETSAPEEAVAEPEPELIEEVEMASKTPEKAFPPIKPRTSTPFVKIKPLEINGKTPKIRLSSNANEGELIKLSIRAMTGEVLSRPSFRIEKNIPRRRGKEPEVNLSALGVTPGYYTVEAEMAGAKSLIEHIFIGTRKNFENLVREYRKEISYRQQWEKKSLLRISTDVAALTKELFEKYGSADSAKEWQDFFGDWRGRWRETDSGEMRSLSVRNQNEYAYPQLWYDMRTVRQKINAEAEELNTAFLSSRRTASSPNRKLLSEASGLVDRVGDLSGWRQKSAK